MRHKSPELLEDLQEKIAPTTAGAATLDLFDIVVIGCIVLLKRD